MVCSDSLEQAEDGKVVEVALRIAKDEAAAPVVDAVGDGARGRVDLRPSVGDHLQLCRCLRGEVLEALSEPIGRKRGLHENIDADHSSLQRLHEVRRRVDFRELDRLARADLVAF